MSNRIEQKAIVIELEDNTPPEIVKKLVSQKLENTEGWSSQCMGCTKQFKPNEKWYLRGFVQPQRNRIVIYVLCGKCISQELYEHAI